MDTEIIGYPEVPPVYRELLSLNIGRFKSWTAFCRLHFSSLACEVLAVVAILMCTWRPALCQFSDLDSNNLSRGPAEQWFLLRSKGQVPVLQSRFWVVDTLSFQHQLHWEASDMLISASSWLALLCGQQTTEINHNLRKVSALIIIHIVHSFLEYRLPPAEVTEINT